MSRARGGVLAVLALAMVAAVTGFSLGFSIGSTKPVSAVVSAAPASAGGPSGSGVASPSSVAGSSSSPDETASPSPTINPLLVPAPVDGLLVMPDEAARHPIAVMIDDLSPARPQSGFSTASVVWQAPAEGGIPRYMLVFQEQTAGDVGPVRSARYYYIAWAAEWHALYVHAGGSPQALQTLRAQGFGQLVYNADQFANGPYFRRVTTRFAPHNLYTTGAQLQALARKVGATAPVGNAVWTFGPDAGLADRPVGGRIDVNYPQNKIHYTYDRATNTYLRSVSVENTETDASNGQRVAPKNVVIMFMQFGPLNDGEPKKHRLEANVVGKGIAYIATNGHTVKGMWRKASLTAPTLFFDSAGKPVTLTAGQTFVQVLPVGSPVMIKDGKPAPAGTP